MESAEVHKISRRSFLKVTAGAAALSGLVLPNAAHAKEENRWATLIDLSLCDGCSGREMPACVSTCKEINKDKIPSIAESIPVPWPRKIVENWSKKQEVFSRLTPYNFYLCP
jgi:Fe-S-cluster-containing dehydrogenase component